MGSIAVSMMVGESLPGPVRKLHPFFTAPRQPSKHADIDEADSETLEASNPISDQSHGLISDAEADETSSDHNPSTRKRRKKVQEEDGVAPEKKRRGRPRKTDTSGASIADHFVRLDRAALPAAQLSGDGAPEEALEVLSEINPLPLTPAAVSSLNVDFCRGGDSEEQATSKNQPATPRRKKSPKSNLKTSPSSSAPKTKEDPFERKQSKPPPARRRRVSSKIVSVKYGDDADTRQRIGTRINGILNNTSRISSSMRSNTRGGDVGSKIPLPSSSKNKATAKDTHPFFLGKAQKPTTTRTSAAPCESTKPNIPTPVRAKHFTSTPCSPKKSRGPPPNARLPHFGTAQGGFKIPGSMLVAWPWKDMVHVRGLDSLGMPTSDLPGLLLPLRKSKGHAVHIGSRESVLENLTRQLDVPAMVEAVRNVDMDNFQPPPAELRVPQKHFESGLKLQSRIQHQLTSKDASMTPLFDSIKTTLSAFDRSECESVSWTQKYAPTCAAEVLQVGKEPLLLREWLRALKVQSVDTGPADTSNTNTEKSKDAKAAKKRKRKKLDDFIVSSDEEAGEMDAISDTEMDCSPSGRNGLLKKTVIRAGDRAIKSGSRLTNAVVISGPHGCGKTAAVYAAAKELDFEVFEIGPSSRRSGKDIMEKIGDMTRNHLVQPQATKATDKDAIVAEDVAKEVDSGKQATMNSFFESKVPSKAKKPAKQVPIQAQIETKKSQPRNQKQSLILLEEVDILYEEDKQFWTTVMGLIAQSKRPFVMTCNDETVVPLQSLSLHAILRFASPPCETAVDRLLMIAANEGHALRREAVASLLEARGGDFRGTLMDLNYWCQIGVGDRRGGFDWFYLRWPKGVDLDEDNQVVRVVSENTYLETMGWLSRDNVMRTASPHDVEEELLEEAWDNWQDDLGHWQASLDMTSWADQLEHITSSKDSQFAYLQAYSHFADAMSLADIASPVAFATANDEPIDPSLPELSPKTREDYLIGLPLLESPLLTKYDSLTRSIAISTRCLARDILDQAVKSAGTAVAPSLDVLQTHHITDRIREQSGTESSAITRIDFAMAFDPIAASDSTQAAAYLDPSVFDRNLLPIAVDVAPYVRSIVAYDANLQKQRLKLSNLVSEGGRATKRMRTTRAAMSALEGGSRSTTRKEKWFKADMNTMLVMLTAGEGWTEAVADAMIAPRPRRNRPIMTDDDDDDNSEAREGSPPDEGYSADELG